MIFLTTRRDPGHNGSTSHLRSSYRIARQVVASREGLKEKAYVVDDDTLELLFVWMSIWTFIRLLWIQYVTILANGWTVVVIDQDDCN